jgi:hypothetical protein
LTFLILVTLMSASLFVEPFAAATTELELPGVTVVAIVLFAALFYDCVHLIRLFFLPRLPADPAVQTLFRFSCHDKRFAHNFLLLNFCHSNFSLRCLDPWQIFRIVSNKD